MRSYGRFLKNTAGILLFLAMIALLFPFCSFAVGGQDITLSGMDVLTAVGKAGYTHLKEGQISNDFVLKGPVTVGTVKAAFTFVRDNGDTRLLAVVAVAAALPVLFCFLAMCMLFLARGKITMLLPTLFPALVLAGMLMTLVTFPELNPYLRIGIYLFLALHGLALVLILIGWLTGGYDKPEESSGDLEQPEQKPKKKHHEWPRRKRFRRKKSGDKKKRKRKKSSRPSSGKNRATGDSKPARQDSQEQKEPSDKSAEAADEKESREIGQQDAHTYVWNDCVISYKEAEKQYQIVNNSLENIVIYNEDTVIGEVKCGETMSVDHFQVLERKETKQRLRMQ